MPKKVRVYVVQTGDCWALTQLLTQLSRCQKVFHFVLIAHNPLGKHLRINPVVHMKETLNLPAGGSRKKILESYLTEQDWAGQTRSFLESCPEGAFFSTAEDFAVAIGGGVYLLDAGDTEFIASREEDAYACIYDYRFVENATEAPEASEADNPASLRAFAAISVLKYDFLFETADKPSNLQNKANRARYIVANLTHFIAARSFWTTLAREHSGQVCVMETNLGGGDYLVGYYTPGLCEACMDLLRSRPTANRVSFPLRHFSETEVVEAIGTLCTLPDKWDKLSRLLGFLSGKLIPLFAVAIGLGLATNLLAGFASTSASGGTDFEQLMTYIREHRLAVGTTLVSTLLALVTGLSQFVLRRGIP